VGDKVAEVYAERYKDALKIKKNRGEAERCKNLIKALVSHRDYEEFVTMLSSDSVTPDSAAPVSIKRSFSTRISKACGTLMASPKRKFREIDEALVLILGRNANGEAVWSSGNVFQVITSIRELSLPAAWM